MPKPSASTPNPRPHALSNPNTRSEPVHCAVVASRRRSGDKRSPRSNTAYRPAIARAVPCPLIAGISAPRQAGLFTTSPSCPPGGLAIARRYSSGLPFSFSRRNESSRPVRSTTRRWVAVFSPIAKSRSSGPETSSRKNPPSERPSTRRTSSPTRCPKNKADSPWAVPGSHSGSWAASSAHIRSQWKKASVGAGSSSATTPAWCDSTWRTLARARNSGQYVCIGASRSRAPRSTSSSAQIAAKGLVTE